MWFKALLGAIGIGGDYLKAKSELKLTKVKGAIDVTKQKAKSIDTWEQTHAVGSQTSWKDEFWTIVWSIPVIMSFTPGGAKFALAGFEALKLMPEWYTYTLMTIVLASFGIRIGGAIKGKIDKWRGKE
jgi:hypothetical protein